MENLVEIPLSDGSFARISKQDEELVCAYRWSPARNAWNTYAIARDGNSTIYMHRLILSEAGEVDHANGDGLDNQRHNLRVCSRSQNMANTRTRQARKMDGARGVYRHGKKWRVVVGRTAEGVNNYVGSFATLEDAIAARDNAAQARWGEFARMNGVSG